MTSQLRVGDAERDEVRRLLNEHLAAGRLTPEEFGDRASRSAQARTRGELMSLFTDLPAPAPDFDGVASSALPEQPAHSFDPARVPVAPPQRDSAPVPRYFKYLGFAVVAPCAVTGVCTGLAATVVYPPVLLLAVLTIAVLFGGLLSLDYFFGWGDGGRDRR